MLRAIKYKVQFPTTGRLIEADLVLDAGVTCISGPNESGKSLVLEMIRYCLFGKAALRGPASDYRNLEARLQFLVDGDLYTVERTPRGETLSLHGEVIASGASTLNDRIPRMLGFNLTVFDVTGVCNQGDIERLTNMRAADRKRMVDSVVGMAQLDSVDRWCRDEASRLRRESAAILESQQRPVRPTRPEDYQPTEVLTPLAAEAEERFKTYARLLGVREPEAPIKPDFPETEDDLAAHEALRVRHEQTYREAEAVLRSVAATNVTIPQVDQWLAWRSMEDEAARRGPKPTIPEATARAAVQCWEAIAAYDAGVCPECGTVLNEAGERPPEPALSLADAEAELLATEAWREPLVEVEYVDIGVRTVPEAYQLIRLIEQQPEREKAQDWINRYEPYEDRSKDLAAVRRYNHLMEGHAPAKAAYDEAQRQLAELGDVEPQVQQLRRQLTEARVYEAQMATFLEAEQFYERCVDQAVSKQRDADALGRASEALRLTRVRVKQHIIPSLSEVSSRYLSSMTAGRRNVIQIDDDFEITVDGQSVETLAGSGKAVANLAIRLGLGQVLTQRVFPVFLGDEIDAAMDAERAGATADTLRGLTERIEQVILVSHKDVEADHKIEL